MKKKALKKTTEVEETCMCGGTKLENHDFCKDCI